ncbi:MAG: hypothetical protein GF315_09800 [candidate division Zixibacteria bacterium]|nr:hypothetical protein [candidate division Zixibacteria bacterium]
MINEYICKVCGAKFAAKDYPKFEDAEMAMIEHIKCNHGFGNGYATIISDVGKRNQSDDKSTLKRKV